MRKLIQKGLTISIIVIALIFLTEVVLAQNENLPNAGITPDNPFYFLDTLGEKIGMFFAFSFERKTEKSLKYAEEKLDEVKVMVEKNKPKAAEKAEQKYQEFLNFAVQKTEKAKTKGKNVENLATLIAERTLQHQEILQELLKKVPSEAKKGIERAIEASKRGYEEAIKSVSGEKKKELEKKTEELKLKIEKENRRYPRTTELFETCVKSYAGEGWELYKEVLELSDSDIEAIFNETAGLTMDGVEINLKTGEFEENLNKGIVGERETLFLGGTWGWGDITPICRNYLMDIDLRPPAYDRLCEEKPDCCELPEAKDIASARKLVKKFFECTGSQIKIDLRETEKLKYGYFVGGGGAIVEAAYITYYLTDTGCLFNCYTPYTEIMGLKHDLIEKKEEEMESEAINIKRKAYEEKIKGKELKLADCLNLSDSYEKDLCVRNLAIERKDKEMCKHISPADWQRSCELDVTIFTKENLTPCRKFADAELPYGVSSLTNGVSLEKWEEKEECVRDIAIISSDTALCNLLYSGYNNLQPKCLKEITGKTK